jgi:hypothetical protein
MISTTSTKAHWNLLLSRLAAWSTSNVWNCSAMVVRVRHLQTRLWMQQLSLKWQCTGFEMLIVVSNAWLRHHKQTRLSNLANLCWLCWSVV